MLNERALNTLRSELLADADERRTDAGMGGEWGDRGAGLIETKVNYFFAGLSGHVPDEWLARYNELCLADEKEQQLRREREAYRKDPDYETFQKLKEKFPRG